MTMAGISLCKTAVITGAGKGLGRAFAHALAAAGYNVVVNNRVHADQENAADKVVSEILSLGGKAVADYSDMQDGNAAETIVKTALTAFGSIDVLILNAGISGTASKVQDTALSAFMSVFETNLFSAISITQEALPYIQKSSAGRVIFIGSTAGLYGVRGRAPYSASKGALIAFAKTLAAEVRRSDIYVNVVVPYAETQMTAGMGGDSAAPDMAPAKVAPLIEWLASDACNRTGDVWVAGGGYFRVAETVESTGAAVTPNVDSTSAWFDENLDTLTDMSGACGFVGAEASFVDLVNKIMVSKKALP
ncbi:SDR family NAD(P)-dependent oxidoreductase [Kordiimonas pumila]|uniref:SDR family NAD(P)-dependent oxidoreductase n=1 Tax=Kordiimonas pumila TaxID=2161677 RepID=A0ABV7D7D0_9PROT|nr:SDR family NAD(P)-dependent oxidoreductase [Kordiimonas pumila]